MSFDNVDTLSRITAPLNGLRRGIDAWMTERQDSEAFRRAGRELANSPVSEDDRLDPLFAALSRHQDRLDVLSATLATSRERERTDCTAVALWVRPLVVLRALCDRALIHHQLRQYRNEMSVYHEALGRAALRNTLGGAMREQPAPAFRIRRIRLANVAKEEGQAVAPPARQ